MNSDFMQKFSRTYTFLLIRLSILKNNIDHIKPIAAPRVDPIIDTTSG